jgi:o-succinylbenzoate synthase
MKIDDITLFHVKLPYLAPFQTSRWVENDHECLLVRLHAGGLTAWGECVAGAEPGYSYETTKTNWHILEDFIIPSVLAANLDDVPAYRDTVEPVMGHNMAKAGLEMALWDLFAQRGGVSLQQALGGTGDRVRVGVSVGIQPTVDRLLEVVDGYLVQGYARVKLKIKPGRDVAETAAVRRAHPDLLLQVDGNSVYRISDATHLAELDDFGLLLIEQPLAHDDIVDHAKLQAALKTAICLDESITSAEHARWALELKACRVINIKPGRVSGLHEGRRIHDLCYQAGVPVWMGGMLETGIGRASNVALASLPGFRLPGDISASARYYHEDVIDPPFVLNPDSTVSVPTGPGLGVNVRPEVVARYTLSEKTYSSK